MKTILDLLNEGAKKNEKYYIPEGVTSEKVEIAYSSNILNMKTVKEGTANAGAFCNRIMEVACTNNIDIIESRVISDIFQRIALDSKHDGNGGSYKDSDWYQISEMMNWTKRGTSLEVIEEKLLKILTGEVIYDDSIESNDNISIEDLLG
ncbi:MAG: hypothetical protein ACRC92_27580 [Peptostreptococcaceae bacterium]